MPKVTRCKGNIRNHQHLRQLELEAWSMAPRLPSCSSIYAASVYDRPERCSDGNATDEELGIE